MLRQQLLTNENNFNKKLSIMALSRLDQQEALRTCLRHLKLECLLALVVKCVCNHEGIFP